MAALRFLNRSLGTLRIAILARLLTPSQFGVFGIGLLVLGFLEIATETGINVFLIQERARLEKYINSAYIVSIFRGFLISFSIFILAAPISTFFNTPEAYSLLILTSFIPLIRGFVNPAVVKFQKNLEFNKEFIKESFLFILETVVAIVVGVATRNEKSLIVAMLVVAIVEVAISFLFIKPRPKLKFERELIQKVINRGKWVTGSGILDYIFTHFDDVVVGKILGPFYLGLYQNAYKISSLLVIETERVFNKVTFPVYITISADKKRLSAAFFKTTAVISLGVIVLGLILIVFSEEIILLVLGEPWLEAKEVLKVLTIFGVLRAISNSTFSLFLAQKKQELVVLITFVSTLGLVLTIFPLVQKYALLGAAYSTIIGTLVSLPLSVYFLRKVFTKK